MIWAIRSPTSTRHGERTGPYAAHPLDARHQAQRRRAGSHQRAVRAPYRLGAGRGPLGGRQPGLQTPRLARPQRRVPPVPDAGRRLADRCRPPGVVHGEGHPGGQGAYLLGASRPRVRDRGRRLRRRRARRRGLPRRCAATSSPSTGSSSAGGSTPWPRRHCCSPARAWPTSIRAARSGTFPWSIPTTGVPSTTTPAAHLLAQPHGASPEQAWDHAEDGGPKLWLIHRLLRHRQQAPRVLPRRVALRALEITGAGAGRALAFCRGDRLAVVIPRRTAGLPAEWADGAVTLAAGRGTTC